MIRQYRYLALIPLTLIFLTLAGCVSTQKYKNDENYNGSKETLSQSTLLIDTGETFELYFVIDRQVPCFDANIHVKIPVDDFTDKQRSVRAYFIVERLIRGSAQGKDAVFSELGRNYTDQWTAVRSVTICANSSSPLQKILSGDIFRVRFAPFVRETFSINLLIQSDGKAMVAKTLEDAEVLARSVKDRNSPPKKGR